MSDSKVSPTNGFQSAPLRSMFLVLNYKVTQILEADLLSVVADIIMNIVELVVHQLMIKFVVEIVVWRYSSIMM